MVPMSTLSLKGSKIELEKAIFWRNKTVAKKQNKRSVITKMLLYKYIHIFASRHNPSDLFFFSKSHT